jgi:hypothetical protein
MHEKERIVYKLEAELEEAKKKECWAHGVYIKVTNSRFVPGHISNSGYCELNETIWCKMQT